MTEINEEKIWEEMIALYKEHEDELISADAEIEKIENEGKEFFERKVVAIKNRLAEDASVKEEDLHKVFVEELEKARIEVLADAEKRIQELLAKKGIKVEE